MASADALSFAFSPHGLDRSNRHESEHFSTRLRHSPRRLAISTQALVRAVKSCPTSPTRSEVEEQGDRQHHKDNFSCMGISTHKTSLVSQETVLACPTSASVEPDHTSEVVRIQSYQVVSSIPTKRPRARHDVDGPGTSDFPCKKRRLRRQLITSRLSQPFSLPATHILNRESDEDDSPCITRFLKAAAIGAKRAGHESSMVRKAAILNSVRLRARQAAIARGHAEMAVLAARNTFLNHGHQVVTAPTVSTSGTRYPVSEGMPGHQRLPVGWRPHTTIGPGQAMIVAIAPVLPRLDISTGSYGHPTGGQAQIQQPAQSNERSTLTMPNTSMSPSSHTTTENSRTRPHLHSEEDNDEEYGMAFPTSDLDARYAELSDDDMDDVYADFSAIFGSRSSSQERGDASPDGVGSPESSEHFYEEYLDELDGIPWMS